MQRIGDIRPLTLDDIHVWLALSRESDPIVADLITDIDVFYDGFDRYMQAKIRQGEAFMAVAPGTDRCRGIIAFSKKHNRITFLGVSADDDLAGVGACLLEFAMRRLDNRRDILATVLDSPHERFRAEKRLYERFGFVQNGSVLEAGVQALLMQHRPGRA